MLAISHVDTTSDIDLVRELLREYFAWVLELASGSCEAPTFQGYDLELAELPGAYALPRGRLLVATWDGHPAGCVALKAHDAETGELKPLYVRPAFRGLHVGKHLVDALIEEAKKSGYRRLTLDSHISMVNAHAIYREAGFKDVDAPAGFPEQFRQVKGDIAITKLLRGASGPVLILTICGREVVMRTFGKLVGLAGAVAICSLLASCGGGTGTAPGSTSRFQSLAFTLAAPKQSYSPGEMVPFTFTVRNVGRTSVSVSGDGCLVWFRVMQAGKIIASPGGCLNSGWTISLKPGASHVYNDSWNQRDIQGSAVPPGDYTVEYWIPASTVDNVTMTFAQSETDLAADPIHITIAP